MLKTAVRLGLPTARRPTPIYRGSLSHLFSSSQNSPSLPVSVPESRSSFSPIHRRAMSAHAGESTLRPDPDKVLQDIADYVHGYKVDSDLGFETARLCLIDTIGCGLEALRFPDCTKLLGPVVEGTIVPNGTPYRRLYGQSTMLIILL